MKDDSMFAFAGLWETWKGSITGQTLRTYTILTTDPNELLEPITIGCPSFWRQGITAVGWPRPTLRIRHSICSDRIRLEK